MLDRGLKDVQIANDNSKQKSRGKARLAELEKRGMPARYRASTEAHDRSGTSISPLPRTGGFVMPSPGVHAYPRRASVARGELLPAITVSESPTSLRLLFPTRGIDMRDVEVIATSRSILVRARLQLASAQQGKSRRGTDHNQIVREIVFNHCIQRDKTDVRFVETGVELTCEKAPSATDSDWSELVEFNTRGSRGSV